MDGGTKNNVETLNLSTAQLWASGIESDLMLHYFEDETGAPSLDNIESDEEYDAVAKKFDDLYGESLEEE